MNDSAPAVPQAEASSTPTPFPSPEAVRLETPERLYNRGTELLKEGDAAAARAYLEKAHRLRPDVAEIQVNLSIARQRLGEKIGITQLDSVTPDWAAWVRPAGIPIAAPLLSLGVLLGVLSVWRQLRRDDFRDFTRLLQSPLTWGAVGSLACAALAASGNAWLSSHPFAVALAPLEVKSGPGPEFVDLGRISAGAGFRLTGESRKSETAGEWIQILHHEGEVGWIRGAPENHLVIDPTPDAAEDSDRAPSHRKSVAQSDT